MPRRPETPIRFSRHTHHEIKPFCVNEVQEKVPCDLIHLVYLTETEPFMQKMFQGRFHGNAQVILEALEQKNLYSKVTGRWAKLPTGDYVEDKLYAPLMELCNEIAGLVRDTDNHNNQVSARWFDRHSHSAGANHDTQVQSRPDCMFATETEAAKNFDKEVVELQEKRDKMRSVDYEKAEKELDRKLHILWMQIHSMFELKRRNRSDIQTLYQLFAYQRQVLTEQLDRRFVIGFVLCGDELQSVLCDRSGIQVTQTSINIHKRPTLFIEIIGALSQMTPEQLGWDTSMKLYPLSTLQEIPSYDVEADFAVENSRYHTHWTIDVADNERVEKFVSVSILSAARSGDICSRATLVFEVVRYSERFNPSEILVLKRYWRPAVESGEIDHPQYPTESRYYEFLQAKDPTGTPKRIHSYGDIRVHNDDGELVVDSTFNTIRLGLTVLDPTSFPSNIEKVKYRRRDEGGRDAELGLYFVTQGVEHSNMGRALCFLNDDLAARTPIDRIHTDILVPRGFVIRLFSDLVELLLCLKACLQDLKNCTEEGIAHRDVSTGNLLIMTDDTGRCISGRLSDFDHAKKTYSFDFFYLPQQIGDKMVKARMNDFLLRKGLPINEADKIAKDVAQVIIEDDVLKYITHLEAREAPAGLRPLSNVMEKWPDFTGYDAKNGMRTGTIPYMSGEVINNTYILDSLYQTPKERQTGESFFMHNPAHDVESCLWVLIHICLTRDGPGINAYRDHPLTASTTQTQTSHTSVENTTRNEDVRWRGVVHKYFDGPIDNISRAKQDLYKKSNGCSIKQITEQFHEYFLPLVPLVEQWWNLIISAHRFHGREYLNIHSLSILLIDDTLQRLETSQVQHPGTNEEIHRRAAQNSELLQTFRKALQKRQVGSSRLVRTAASSGFEISPNATKKFKPSEEQNLEMMSMD